MQVARLEELSSLFESRLLLLETTVALFPSAHLSCLAPLLWLYVTDAIGAIAFGIQLTVFFCAAFAATVC